MDTAAATLLVIGTNLVAIGTLAYGIYFQRHRRRDMLIAYLALDVGVLAVTLVLASASVAAGLGLGLFGVLSIIRLRSNALTQEEVAYYFAALALGLIAGLRPDPLWVAPVTTVLVVGVMYVADHPRIYAGARHQTIVLDAAVTDERDLRARLARLLDAEVTRVFVTETDLVRDVTVVDVRYTVRPAGGTAEEEAYAGRGHQDAPGPSVGLVS
jgi:hypothetical protein